MLDRYEEPAYTVIHPSGQPSQRQSSLRRRTLIRAGEYPTSFQSCVSYPSRVPISLMANDTTVGVESSALISG